MRAEAQLHVLALATLLERKAQHEDVPLLGAAAARLVDERVRAAADEEDLQPARGGHARQRDQRWRRSQRVCVAAGEDKDGMGWDGESGGIVRLREPGRRSEHGRGRGCGWHGMAWHGMARA
eukprot:1987634-Prymnesium_polylepis.1